MASPLHVTRHADPSEGDYFPTPPWATRALVKYVAPILDTVSKPGERTRKTLEPAAGGGHMSRTLEEYGHEVMTVEKFNRDFEPDFRDDYIRPDPYTASQIRSYGPEFAISNPPYDDIEAWFHAMYADAKRGVAIMAKAQFLQTKSRYENIFLPHPPTVVGIFMGRIPFVKNRIVRSAPAYFHHIWCYWDKVDPTPRAPVYIPYDAQQLLEKDEDYANG